MRHRVRYFEIGVLWWFTCVYRVSIIIVFVYCVSSLIINKPSVVPLIEISILGESNLLLLYCFHFDHLAGEGFEIGVQTSHG